MLIATPILVSRGHINADALSRLRLEMPRPPERDGSRISQEDHLAPFASFLGHVHQVHGHRQAVHAEHAARVAEKKRKELEAKLAKTMTPKATPTQADLQAKAEAMKRDAIFRAEAKVEAKHAAVAHTKRLERRKAEPAGPTVRYRKADGTYGRRKNPHYGKTKMAGPPPSPKAMTGDLFARGY